MCKIFGAWILYDLIVTHTVSASNKKSTVHEIDNEKRAIELLNVSSIPCMDLLKKQGEKSLIKFNVRHILYLILLSILLFVEKHNDTLLGISNYILGIWKTW